MHANVVVGLLLIALVAQAALSLRLMRLRSRVERVEAKELELMRSIAAVEGWAGQEIGGLAGAVTVREAALPLAIKPGPNAEAEAEAEAESKQDLEEQRATLATPAPVEVLQRLHEGDNEPDEDNEATTVFDSEALCHALRSTPWLGPASEEEQPARAERSAMFVKAFQHPPEKEGTPWPP